MRTGHLVRLELEKTLRRKESFLLLTVCLLPVMFSVGLRSGSPNFVFSSTQGRISCLDWVTGMVGFLHDLVIFYFFVSIVAVRGFGNEIEDHSLQLVLPRANSRVRVFFAKLLSSLTAATCAFVIYVVVSACLYYGVLVGASSIADGNFAHDGIVKSAVFDLAAVYVSTVLVVVIAHCLCVVIKPLLSIVLPVVVVVAASWLIKLPVLAYVLPWFYMERVEDLLNGLSPEDLAPALFVNSPGWVLVVYLAVAALWAALLVGGAVVRFRGRDL